MYLKQFILIPTFPTLSSKSLLIINIIFIVASILCLVAICCQKIFTIIFLLSIVAISSEFLSRDRESKLAERKYQIINFTDEEIEKYQLEESIKNKINHMENEELIELIEKTLQEIQQETQEINGSQ